VLNNGDVILTWVPATDPNGQFTAYEVWSSAFAAGPYSSVTAVAPVTTYSALHAAANATAQTIYYYVTTRYSGGVSPPSDTLHTIFLNLFQATDDLKMNYNTLRKPPLPSTASTYTLLKEYPIGTTKVMTITPHTNWADTIDVCRAKISYQAMQADASGCVSKSNVIIGDYSDTKAPDSTSIDSISVLPDGRTVIGWSVPNDRDVDRYFLILHTDTQNTYIDSVSGRNTTIYTYTPHTAELKSISLSVSALDSCDKIGPFDQTPRTMFLKADYNRCAYQTMLSWNSYQGMRGGILEYRVYYSVNGSPYKQIGSTQAPLFIHNKTDPGANLSYFVRVVSGDKKITASSNRIYFFSRQAEVPQFMYLSAASVTGPNAVELSLFIDETRVIEAIEIERSEDSVTFTRVGSAPYTGDSWYTFVDGTAQPGSRSYYYRAFLRDSCGNIRGLSNAARTVHLKVGHDPSSMFTQHLSWNGYEGFSGGTAGYYIYRLVNGAEGGAPIGSTGPEARGYTDNIEGAATEGALVEYRVEAVEGLDNIYGIRSRALSNKVQVFMEDQLFIPNAFAPGGLNRTWRPYTHFVDKNEYRVVVFDRWGHEIFLTRSDQEAWDGGGHPAGIYAYLVTYKNSRGEYKELAGYITLIR
jgi:hypothetical protein